MVQILMASLFLICDSIWKTDRIDTITEIHFLLVDKVHYSETPSTKTRCPGLLLQAAFLQRCQTTRAHFMASMAPEGH